MLLTRRLSDRGIFALAVFAAIGLCGARPAAAQEQGYHVGEDQKEPTVAPRAEARSTGTIHRLARIEYLSGSASWRPDSEAKWERAENHHTLAEGDQLKVEEGGRAEIRFDDDSILRVGGNSNITFKTVFLDAQGEYTQITMNSGLATLEAREERSVFEVNTPGVTVKTMGPSRIRIGVESGVEVAVTRGRANLEGPQGKKSLVSGDFVSLHQDDKTYVVHAIPAPDSWDRWNQDRDRKLAEDEYTPRYYAPPSRESLGVFFSLGFPVFGGYRGPYRAYRRHW